MFGFGKKKTNSPPQKDNLGNLLDAMMRDPEKNQGAFYMAFLTSNVFILGEAAGGAGKTMLQDGDKVRVMQWMDPHGNPFIPVFTSKEEMERSIKDMPGETPFLAMSGYDALNLTQGQVPAAIDPAKDHCLHLVPPQIAQILNYFDSIKNNS